MKQLVYLILFFLSTTLVSCTKKEITEYPELSTHYLNKRLYGSFILFDESNKSYIVYNLPQLDSGFTPASTFKIFNTLAGLETYAIPNENVRLKWDGIPRQNPNWNHDQDLSEAYKNSTVWFYQEIARKIGYDRMNFWVKKAKYGNENTEGGIDQFWLSGKLRITPKQQIDFLTRLKHETLPFSKKNIGILKQIMIEEKTPDYILRSKTGWGTQDNKEIGWYVGYIEKEDKTYYFANCIQSTDSANAEFGNSRITIARDILKELKVLP